MWDWRSYERDCAVWTKRERQGDIWDYTSEWNYRTHTWGVSRLGRWNWHSSLIRICRICVDLISSFYESIDPAIVWLLKLIKFDFLREQNWERSGKVARVKFLQFKCEREFGHANINAETDYNVWIAIIVHLSTLQLALECDFQFSIVF